MYKMIINHSCCAPIMIKIAPIMKKYTKFCKECDYKSLKTLLMVIHQVTSFIKFLMLISLF